MTTTPVVVVTVSPDRFVPLGNARLCFPFFNSERRTDAPRSNDRYGCLGAGGTGWPPGTVAGAQPAADRGFSNPSRGSVLGTTIIVNRRRPLCRHGDRAIRLPASRNCTAHTSSSRIRPLASMSNSDRAGSLVATNSTKQKTGSSPPSSAVYTTRRLPARSGCGESRGGPGRALRC